MNKTELVRLRLDPTEKATFQDAAEISGISLSAWARERLRRAAIRDLEEASQPIRLFLDRKLGQASS